MTIITSFSVAYLLMRHLRRIDRGAFFAFAVLIYHDDTSRAKESSH